MTCDCPQQVPSAVAASSLHLSQPANIIHSFILWTHSAPEFRVAGGQLEPCDPELREQAGTAILLLLDFSITTKQKMGITIGSQGRVLIQDTGQMTDNVDPLYEDSVRAKIQA